MGNYDLIGFDDAEELALAAARDWLHELEAAAARDSRYCVALSGGRAALRFLSAAAELVQGQGTALGSVHFFWSDERCVSPTDSESNFRLARDCFLAPLAISDGQIHRVRGEGPPESAATEAEAELRRFASHEANGQPVLDLVFLGLGEDGHVASLFPGEPPEIMASAAVFRPVVAPKPPPRRITLGYPVIGVARQVWVLVSGREKEGVLRQSLAPAGRTPLARVLKSRDRTRIFSEKMPGLA